MFNVRNEEQVESQFEVDGKTFELVAKEWSAALATEGYGFAMTYRRPVAIRTDPSTISIRLRDHVMIVRFVAVLVFIVALARRYIDG